MLAGNATAVQHNFTCNQGIGVSATRVVRQAPAAVQRLLPAASAARDHGGDGDRDIASLLGSAYLRPEFNEGSEELVRILQADDLVDAAAGLISVLDELRPLDPERFNAAYEIWRAIAAVPPQDRTRILDELEPGAIAGLWRASVGRYALDDARAAEIFRDYIIWQDFPSAPGEVFWYDGACEQLQLQQPSAPLMVDSRMQARLPRRASPWLKPSPRSVAVPRERFRQAFFQANRSGLLYGRMLLDLPGPLSLLSPASYCRTEVGLTLLPRDTDAGADVALVYPSDAALLAAARAAGAALEPADLPSALWPHPQPGPAWSPLSFGPRDYMRAAGPGFFVGCAYRRDEAGELLDDEHVFFALARRYD